MQLAPCANHNILICFYSFSLYFEVTCDNVSVRVDVVRGSFQGFFNPENGNRGAGQLLLPTMTDISR